MKKNTLLIAGILVGLVLAGAVFWEYAYHPLYNRMYLYDGYLPKEEVRAVITGTTNEGGALYHISGDLSPKAFASAMKHLGVEEMSIMWERGNDSELRAIGHPEPMFPRMYLHHDGSATFPQGTQREDEKRTMNIFRFLSELGE